MTLPSCTVRRFLTVGFVFLLSLPAMQMQWRFVKESPLGGVEQGSDAVSWSVSSWLDGTAESMISDRVARRIGFRPICVRAVNQSMLALNSGYRLDVPAQVTIGKNDWLYESAYVQSYTRPQPTVSQADLDTFVGQLHTLQTMLARRGTTMLLIISPSKAEIYPEYLPDAAVAIRKQFTGRRDYDGLVERLEREHINFIDSPKLLRDLRSTAEPLFSRTGTHWNYYACFLVWREALKKINACSSLCIPVPELVGIEYDEPRGTDNDLGSLLNVFVLPSGTPQVPYPIVSTTVNAAGQRSAFLFVGTSFSWTLVNAMYMSQSGAYCDLLYYNKSYFRLTHDATALRPGDRVRQQWVCSLDDQPPDWSQLLFDKQVVVLELLETDVAAREWGFCQQAIGALSQLPEQQIRGGPIHSTARTPSPASR